MPVKRTALNRLMWLAIPALRYLVGRQRNMVRLPDGRRFWPLVGDLMREALGFPFSLDFAYFADKIPRSPGGKFEEFICELA